MTKPLRSFPEPKRREIALRRAAGKTYGNGYSAALDYLAKTGLTKESKYEAKPKNK